MQGNHEDDLPRAPAGKTGWPWINESNPVSLDPEVNNCPKISIVIPTYNQVRYLEQAIRSILMQCYPNLELIVIDGGSTDGSVEILKKYDKFITWRVSEADRGQTHAINKGMQKATGDILAYLNSDDIYLPGAFTAVAEFVKNNPDIDLIHGGCQVIDESDDILGERWGSINSLAELLDLWDVWWKQRNFVQPEVFWTRRIADKAGPFREDLYFVMDYDYWLKIFLAGGQVGRINRLLSAFRITSGQKSRQSDKVAIELLDVVRPVLWNQQTPLTIWQRLKLQSRWLYQNYFLRQVEKSLAAKENTAARWLRLIGTVMQHPKILANPRFYERIITVLHRFKFRY